MMIVNDEINARLAFINFSEIDKSRAGESTFDEKVENMIRHINSLKSIIEQKQTMSDDHQSKETHSKILKQIEFLQEQANNLISKSYPSDASSNPAIERLIKSLGELTSSDSQDDKSSDNVSYELLYNKECKNVLVAAKISELKKRMEIIQK